MAPRTKSRSVKPKAGTPQVDEAVTIASPVSSAGAEVNAAPQHSSDNDFRMGDAVVDKDRSDKSATPPSANGVEPRDGEPARDSPLAPSDSNASSDATVRSPPTDPPLHKGTYSYRGEKGGVFELLTAFFEEHPRSVVSNLDIGKDFKPMFENSWQRGTIYKSNETGRELRSYFFGELLPEECGTKVSAVGSFFFGTNPDEERRVINDNKNVKLNLALGVPEFATDDLKFLWALQQAALSDVRVSDEKEDTEVYDSRDWFRSKTGDLRATQDVLIVSTVDSIYEATQKKGAQRPSVQDIKRRRLQQLESKKKESASKVANSRDVYPSADKVEVGAFYSCDLLPDYGSNVFNHATSRLKQLNIRDERNRLIPMWRIYEYLVPGAFVLIEGVMKIFRIPPKDRSDNKPTKKYYQVQAEVIRILDRSMSPAVIPSRKEHPPLEAPASASGKPTGTSDLSTFEVPRVHPAFKDASEMNGVSAPGKRKRSDSL